ncbi:MAG: hypothetical protein LUC26_04155 [Prevotella sp.]|nr:hypothetical protein [Prevotella sp.]
MRRFFYVALIAVAAVSAACGGRNKKGVPPEVPNDSIAVSEDSTVYGLACEGCSDSAVWLLPPDASDPIPYDIVNAMRRHKIFGKIKTGDAIAVVVNPTDSTVADMVIDLDQLKGTWCYVVMPTLKNADNLSKSAQEHIIAMLPDSIKEAYYQPVEYGFTLKRNDVASPVGLLRSLDTDDDNPFVYSDIEKYSAWSILNGRLVLTKQVNQRIITEPDTLAEERDDGQGERKEKDKGDMPIRVESKSVNDTADIVFLMEDSLVLRFKDRTQGYYRQK